MLKRVKILGLLTALVLGVQGMNYADEPVDLRLKWQPGQTFTYQAILRVTVSAAGESADVVINLGIVLRVVPPEGALNADRTALEGGSGAGQIVTPSGRPLEVELSYTEFKMVMNMAGKKFETTVSKDEIRASLDGSPLPSFQMATLRREMEPARKMIAAPLRLSMTDRGRALRVTGLEGLDPQQQKELATGLLEAVLLPEQPMRVGDQYTEKRKLESFLPKQPGETASKWGDRTVDIIRTLRSVQRDGKGRLVAELHAPVKFKLNDVPLGEEGLRGSMEADLTCTTFYDTANGTPLNETVRGTVFLRPTSAGAPSLITSKVDMSFHLVEPTKPETITASEVDAKRPALAH